MDYDVYEVVMVYKTVCSSGANELLLILAGKNVCSIFCSQSRRDEMSVAGNSLSIFSVP
jgi:hypothetical protein